MIVLRFLLMAGFLVVSGAVVAYLFTRNRRYLIFAWQFFKFMLVFLVGVGLFYVVERLILI